MDIGGKIKSARISANLTQEQVADFLNVSRQTISNWENGKTYPDIVSVVKMSDLYGISLDYLLKEGKPMSNYLNYLEESTNAVKSKNKLSAVILIAVYLGIWTISLLSFWLFNRRLRNAINRINTALFVPENQITPHWIWYNRVVQKL